ncbi:SWPV2-ORF281 [Shearwaterpox virus]|uniref:SWPV2-ORF281 n=1 Tax=Shearwaterpox virus TaxID=1974596 RepID=A0A1V0QGQ7_CNPV|nr:SWPV2-ORF281 [Shearwaterpox virus]QRM15574.1 ankyrin repeat protein [Mudlarkpox virus]QRM15927.1 ankyrin repeat protein [Penguinpox virus 2]QRM16264.1 ankyrin repeat protein [Albatrosspox virus]
MLSISLYRAISRNNVESVEKLLDNGASPNSYIKGIYSPIMKAIKGKNKEIVKLLLVYGAQIDSKYYVNSIPPLIAAITVRSLEIINYLLDYGCDINSSYYKNKHPIEYAVIYNNTEIVKKLLDHNSYVNVKDSYGRNMLHKYNTFYEMTKLLVDNGIDINCKDNYGSIPLHYAAKKSELPVIDLLISNTNINSRNNRNNTPLHYATFYNYPSVVMRLLFKGADITIRNDDGKTPLEYVCKPHIKMVSNIKKIIEYAVMTNELYPGIIQASGIESRRELINSESEIKDYEYKCFEEIRLIKEFVISGTGVTLLDVCLSKRRVNHRYSKLLTSLNYDNFAIYKDYISLCINEAISREIQIEDTIKLLDNIFVHSKNRTTWSNLPYSLRYRIAEIININ